MLYSERWYKGKFDGKGEEGILLGYSTRIKAYKCLNTNTKKIMESVNVKVDEYSKLKRRKVGWGTRGLQDLHVLLWRYAY